MHKLTINNQILELDSSLFYHYISNTIISLYNVTEIMFSMQVMGYPDTFQEITIPHIKRDILVLEESIKQIEDEDLRGSLSDISRGYRSLINVDNEMANLISVLTGLTHDDIRASGQFGNFQKETCSGDATHPEWYDNIKFKQHLKSIESIMVSILEDMENAVRSLMCFREDYNSGADAEITRRTLDKISDLRIFLSNSCSNMPDR